MESLAAVFSTSGCIAQKPFVRGALAVYAASFLAQFLLASPVTARASVVPFVAAKILAAWAWYGLHVRRLRDAGQATGPALGLTILYALAVMLLLVVLVVGNNMTLPDTSGLPTFAVGIIQVFLLVFLASLVIGAGTAIGMFGYVFLGALVLISLPVLIAIVFTLWLASRPSVPPVPPVP